MTAEHPGASAVGVLPAALTLDDVPWDDADGARLRAEQQAEIAVRYGQHDDAPSDADTSGADGAGEVPGPTDEAAHGVDPVTVVAAVLLRVDGEPAGFGALRDLSGTDDPSGIVHGPGTAELKRLYVAPRHRGRGLSRLVLRALEARAVALGVRRIVLETGTQQPESIGLYLGEGYLPIEQYGEFWSEHDSRCFAKELPLPVTVVPTTWDDPAAVALRERFLREEIVPDYPHLADLIEDGGGVAAFDATLGRRAAITLVARRGGDVVGCAHAVEPGHDDAPAGTLDVVRVYVAREARRWGVARILMTALAAAARERGATRLELVTGIRQPAAVTLYRSLGFRPAYPSGAQREDPTALWFELGL